MFSRRDGHFYRLSQVLIVDQLLVPVFADQFFKYSICFQGPVKSLGFTRPVDGPQVVNHVAAPDNQHTFVTQWGKFPGNIVLILSILIIIETHLNYRYRSVRIHLTEHTPCAMIKAPFFIRFNFCAINRGLHLHGKFRTSGRRILHVK